MSRPFILIVDDEPDLSESLRPLLHFQTQEVEVEVEILHPRDVQDMHLSEASVIVIDHYLKYWKERDSQIPSLRIKDGIALAATFRSQVAKREPSPAIVLRTGRLEQLRGNLPSKAAQHLIAWQHDIEWVLPKTDLSSESSGILQLVEFAKAVVLLKKIWDKGISTEYLISDWLGLGQPDWLEVAVDDVSETRPPVHSVARRTRGASIVRWFLHRILPYPTFLLNEQMVAIKLGVEHDWLVKELTKNSKFSSKLGEFRYKGAFSEFDGHRWWRAGLSNFIVQITGGKPFDLDLVKGAIRSRSCTAPDFLPHSTSVLAIDPDTKQFTKVVNADHATRIVPDGWPTFADDAWAVRSDINDDPDLAELVVDRNNLSESDK